MPTGRTSRAELTADELGLLAIYNRQKAVQYEDAADADPTVHRTALALAAWRLERSRAFAAEAMRVDREEAGYELTLEGGEECTAQPDGRGHVTDHARGRWHDPTTHAASFTGDSAGTT